MNYPVNFMAQIIILLCVQRLCFACPSDLEKEAPTQVKVYFTPEKLSLVDEKSSTFKVTYYLSYEYDTMIVDKSLSCKESYSKIPSFIFDPKIEIMHEEQTKLHSKINVSIENGRMLVEWKASSVILNNFDFSYYPFDTQNFLIQIMGYFPSKSLKFKLGELDQDSFENMKMNGWEKSKFISEANQETWDKQTYDSLQFTIQASRNWLTTLTRVLLPMFLIVVLTLFTTLLPKQEIKIKSGLQMSCLLSLITFNIVLQSLIPSLSYLTLVDIITLISFVIAFICLCSTIVSSRALWKMNET